MKSSRKTIGIDPLDGLHVENVKKTVDEPSSPAKKRASQEAHSSKKVKKEPKVVDESDASNTGNASNDAVLPLKQDEAKPQAQKLVPLPSINDLINQELGNRTEMQEDFLEPAVEKIIKKSAQYAVVGGLVPLPVLDSVFISIAQIQMVKNLCAYYRVPFEKKRVIAIVSGIVGGSATTAIAHLGGRALLSTIPGVGVAVNIVGEPALGYASTYAMGKVFATHFKNSGVLNNVDPKELNFSYLKQIAAMKK